MTWLFSPLLTKSSVSPRFFFRLLNLPTQIDFPPIVSPLETSRICKMALDLTETRGPELLVVTWIFTALTIIIVSLKLYTRTSILHALGIDDFFIFLSAVSPVFLRVILNQLLIVCIGSCHHLHFNFYLRCKTWNGQACSSPGSGKRPGSRPCASWSSGQSQSYRKSLRNHGVLLSKYFGCHTH